MAAAGALLSNDMAFAPPADSKGNSGPSLYCFAGVIPDSFEPALLTLQNLKGWGIFACGETDVFSSAVVELGTGVQTIVVDSDFRCDLGGDFGTALNTDIFLAVWDKVFERRVYFDTDWTVKADADTAFFPHRLQRSLAGISELPHGVYINNCQFGLHGPLEVFSKNAVSIFAGGKDSCKTWLNDLCSGPCPFGEDMWLDKCLQDQLNVHRNSIYSILSEDHCDGDGSWMTCKDTSKAAFHPFKSADDFTSCITNALLADGTDSD